MLRSLYVKIYLVIKQYFTNSTYTYTNSK